MSTTQPAFPLLCWLSSPQLLSAALWRFLGAGEGLPKLLLAWDCPDRRDVVSLQPFPGIPPFTGGQFSEAAVTLPEVAEQRLLHVAVLLGQPAAAFASSAGAPAALAQPGLAAVAQQQLRSQSNL